MAVGTGNFWLFRDQGVRHLLCFLTSVFLLSCCVARVLCCVAGVSGALPSTMNSCVGTDGSTDSLTERVAGQF